MSDTVATCSAQLVEEICPLLAGHHPPLQGAALADLLAIWIAGHFADTPKETERLRTKLLAAQIEAVRKLIPVHERLILSQAEPV